jgi:hypothetical protein
MSNIRLLAVLPFLAFATAANAGTTISDSRYWPSMAHPNPSLNSHAQAVTPATQRQSGEVRVDPNRFWTYRGGPKTGVWSSR